MKNYFNQSCAVRAVTAFTFLQKSTFPKWRLIPFRQDAIRWNLDETKGQGLAKSIRYSEVSLGSFPYILLLLRQKISFVIRLRCIQLFRERLSEKVHATTPKCIVGGLEVHCFHRNLGEWQERPWTYVCECLRKVTKVGSTATVSGIVY